MKNYLNLAAIALAVALGPIAIAAPESTAVETAETVEGVVTKIDLEIHRVVVRNSDGTTYEFEASDETLKDLKVGDAIAAKRRPTPK